jgi:hypothetical protein
MRTVRAATSGIVLACASLAASLALTPAAAAPGGGGGGGSHKPDDCVTQGEYDKVRTAQPRTAVHKRWGTVGHRVSITRNGPRATEVRTYDVCKSPDSSVNASFEKGARGPFKLESKTAVWVD